MLPVAAKTAARVGAGVRAGVGLVAEFAAELRLVKEDGIRLASGPEQPTATLATSKAVNNGVAAGRPIRYLAASQLSSTLTTVAILGRTPAGREPTLTSPGPAPRRLAPFGA
jgi:hypothetical protein